MRDMRYSALLMSLVLCPHILFSFVSCVGHIYVLHVVLATLEKIVFLYDHPWGRISTRETVIGK
jgi:hypothetical protein